MLAAGEFGEGAKLGVAGLRIEAVGVATGDAGHARSPTADNDGRGDLGAGKALGAAKLEVLAVEVGTLARPEVAQHLRRLGDLGGAHAVGGYGAAEHGLLGGVGEGGAAAGAESEDEAVAADLLEGGGHVREEAGVAVRDVEDERPEHDTRGGLGDTGEGDQRLGHASAVVVGVAQVVPRPDPIEAGFLGGDGSLTHLGVGGSEGHQEKVGLHETQDSGGGGDSRSYNASGRTP